MLGLNSPHDAWIAYQYDMTCAKLGMWAEAMLSQMTKQGKPKYSLEGLLADQKAVFARKYRTDFDQFPVEIVEVA